MIISRTNQRGFTLLEVMFTVAIIGIVASIGFIIMDRSLPVYRLREATRDVASTFQQARLEAIRRSSQCAVEFGVTVGAETFDYLVYVDADQDFIFDAGEQQLGAKRLSDYDFVFWGNDPDGDGIDDGVANALTAAVSFPVNTSGNPVVAFNNRGLSLNAIGGFGAGTVSLENTQARVRQVVVNAAGNVRVQQ